MVFDSIVHPIPNAGNTIDLVLQISLLIVHFMKHQKIVLQNK